MNTTHSRPRPRAIAIVLLAALGAMLILCPRAAHAEGRILRQSVVVPAPVEDVWRDFSTPEGIVRSWSVAKAEVDFRIGGAIRTVYEPDAEIGGPSTITNIILSFEPRRMLSLKAVAPQNAPGPVKLICEHGWSVMRFEPLGPRRTRITVTGMGYGEGPEWDAAYAFFEAGNRWTLDQMKRRYEQQAPADPAAEARRTMQLLRSLSRGEWIHEHTREDGGVFRSRTRMTETLGGAFILSEGWLGDDRGMREHAVCLFGIDPESGQAMMWEYMEGGLTVRAPLTVKDDNTLVFDWVMHRPGDARTEMDAHIELLDDDRYRTTIYMERGQRERAEKPFIDIVSRRVESPPAPFLVMKPGGTTMPNPNEPAPITAEVISDGLRCEAVVAAPVEAVWRAWTTDEGVRAFFAPMSNIELRPGGPYEILFLPNAPEGGRGAEGCSVLSFIHEEMLSFTWNAPPTLPNAREHPAWVVVTLTPLSAARTHVRLRMAGYDSLRASHPEHADEFTQARDYFAGAWPTVLTRLRDAFDGKPMDWSGR